MVFLTELSLKKASVTLLIAIALVLGGIYAVLNVNQELTPDLDFPLITIVTTQLGAGPQDVADEVSAPLEMTIANVPGLKSLQSVSAENISIVIAQFDFGHDMKAAEQEISRNVASVSLPSTASTPQVTRININQTLPVIHLTLAAENTGLVNRDIQRRISALALPSGVEVEYGGVLQQFQESFNTLFVGIGAAVVIVYIVMVLVMGSLLRPFVIMFSLPLASIGALAALVITGRALSLPSLFGILMLVGIVVTNGIVLIDFVNQLRNRGYSIHDALMEGGRLRLRPVLMTAVTTILALLPMSLGFTEGAIIAAELATVVIGGLVTSTVLTLVVVPVVYSIVEGWRGRFTGGGSGQPIQNR